MSPMGAVLVAFAVSWLAVIAWVARIGRKVNGLLDSQDGSTDG